MKTTKIFAIIGMVIFFLGLTTLFIFAYYKIANPPVLSNSTENSTGGMCGGNSCPMMIILNSNEIAKHNSANDCWMIINGGVYDLTNFLNLHSGGSQFILEYCGKDGSVGFNTKDQTGSHSERDRAVLSQYYLGDLGQQIKA